VQGLVAAGQPLLAGGFLMLTALLGGDGFGADAEPGQPGVPGGDAGSIANKFQCQPGHDKGCEKDRQEPLSGASEGDDLFPGGVEGLSAARVSSIADLQGVTSRLDWYLDRVVHFDRPGPLTVEHDIVRATTDLRSDCLMRHLQRRRHLLISSCF
jgi:hypothetical protein